MKHETTLRLHRAALMDRSIRGDTWIDVELFEQGVERDAGHDPSDPYSHCAIRLVQDHRNHRLLEAGIADPWKRQQQFAGERGEITRCHMPVIGIAHRYANRVTPLSGSRTGC